MAVHIIQLGYFSLCFNLAWVLCGMLFSLAVCKLMNGRVPWYHQCLVLLWWFSWWNDGAVQIMVNLILHIESSHIKVTWSLEKCQANFCDDQACGLDLMNIYDVIMRCGNWIELETDLYSAPLWEARLWSAQVYGSHSCYAVNSPHLFLPRSIHQMAPPV